MEPEVRTFGKVNWAAWLNAEDVRKVNPKYTTQSQWVRDFDHSIPLFDSPEDALEWVLGWIKNKNSIRFYEAKEFSREVSVG